MVKLEPREHGHRFFRNRQEDWMQDKRPFDIAGSTAQSRAKKPWSAPRIQDAPVATTTMSKTPSFIEGPYIKTGS